MADSLADQVKDRLKVKDETNRDANKRDDGAVALESRNNPPVAQLSIHAPGSNKDEEEDKTEEAEAEDNEADMDSPTESEETKELWLQLEEAQAELAALPEDDKTVSEKLSYIADLRVKYHSSAGTTTEKPFLEALRTATQAREYPAADAFSRSLAMYIQMVCSSSLYECTKNASYLHQSVVFGKESIEEMKNASYTQRCHVHSARCAHLAAILEKLYEVEGLIEHISSSVSFQGDAVDDTHPDEYGDQYEGDILLYHRYKKWVTVCIKLMDKRPDLSSRMPESLIDQVTNRLPCTLDKDAKITAHDFWLIRLGLYCRLWANTKDLKNLKLLRESTSELMKWEADDPQCTCHGNKDIPSMSTDPEDLLQVMRRAAGFFDNWFDLDNKDSEWYGHLATIDTSIALWEKVSHGISRLTFADLDLDFRPTSVLEDRLRQRYAITKKPRDGWRADSKQWEFSGLNMLLTAVERGSHNPTDSIAELLACPGISIGESCVTGEQYSVWNVRRYGKPWNLDNQRLKFVGGDGPWTIDRWIRERSDNGKFVLGGARKGRDDDVLDFIANQSRTMSVDDVKRAASKLK